MKTLLRRTCRFTALLLVLLWGGAALPALAAPRTVTNTNDSGAGSLRFWINNAVPGDTIVFTNTLNGGTILLTSGELIVPQNLTIIGPGMTNLAVSGNHSNRVFEILTNITASISGLAIKNGSIVGTNGIIGVDLSASGGGVLNRGTLALTNCIISGNTVAGGTNIGSGGQAIAGGLLNYGALTLTGCLITGNSASGGSSSFAGAAQGGGMYNYGALTLTSCTLTGNRAGGGNGGWGGDAGSGAGGGILNNGVLMLTGCTLSSNSAAGGDSDNYGVGQGGGIANFGTILLTNCTLTANSASGGAGSE